MIYKDYSNARIVKWLREKIFCIDKPPYLPLGRWDRWYHSLRASRPIAWFLTEKAPSIVERTVEIILNPVIGYKNRMVMKYIIRPHQLTTGLDPHCEHDYKKKFLHALFTELTNYIEVVLANRWVSWSITQQRKYGYPKRLNHWWLRWRPWRCAQAGLDSLKWQVALLTENTSCNTREQSLAYTAQEIILLYSWWTRVRPTRGTSWGRVGLDKFMIALTEKYGIDSLRRQWEPDEELTYQTLIALQEQLEQDWEREDHAMMVRLINVSPNLVY
jgi:hypothetical protein